ncbi:MAG TPA: cation:proton antiporter [Steroidobacteraceae bacterium]|nr:cation:proton antiporter [Steroidobacteraceae bacterium]
MSDVSFMLLLVAGIFLVGALGEVVFAKTRVPDVVWLIIAGWLLGPVSGVIDAQVLLGIAPYFAAFALIVILFNGGTSLRLDGIMRAAPRALLLALAGFVLATAVVAAVSMAARAAGILPDGWTWLHGAMLGSMLGGSSSIIIMPAMATAQVRDEVANLVNLESAFTDALCVVGASACVAMLLHHGSSNTDAALVLLKSFATAFAIGAAAGLLWLFLLHLLRDAEHAYPITLAGLLLLYVGIEAMGASAAMGILTFAVVVGNARLLSRRLGMVTDIDLGMGVRGFHSQMAFIVKSFFFVMIGALLTPPWSSMAFGVLLAAVLFAARWPAVRLATLGSDLGPGDRALVGVCLPRGMAAGVLATVPMAAGVAATEGLPVVVFSCIVATIAVFAIGLPLVMRRARAAPVEPPAPSGPPAPPADAAAGPPAA